MNYNIMHKNGKHLTHYISTSLNFYKECGCLSVLTHYTCTIEGGDVRITEITSLFIKIEWREVAYTQLGAYKSYVTVTG